MRQCYLERPVESLEVMVWLYRRDYCESNWLL